MRMKILLLVSSFNGLTQRAWCALREAGHDVSVELAIDEQTIISGVEAAKPDLVLCPFLKERVPAAEQGKGRQWRSTLDCKAERARRAAKPLSYFETRELAEMAGDMFDDRKGFAAARRAFMYKEKPTGTPAKLALHRQVEMAGVA
jgi:hypothetical protein